MQKRNLLLMFFITFTVLLTGCSSDDSEDINTNPDEEIGTREGITIIDGMITEGTGGDPASLIGDWRIVEFRGSSSLGFPGQVIIVADDCFRQSTLNFTEDDFSLFLIQPEIAVNPDTDDLFLTGECLESFEANGPYELEGNNINLETFASNNFLGDDEIRVTYTLTENFLRIIIVEILAGTNDDTGVDIDETIYQEYILERVI